MAQTASILSERAQRFPLVAPVHYRGLGMTQWLGGRTVNLSRTGILFQADDEILKNAILDIRVDLARHLMLECQCTVVRTEETLIAVHIHRHCLSAK